MNRFSLHSWWVRFEVLLKKVLRQPSFYITAFLCISLQLILGGVALPSASNTAIGLVMGGGTYAEMTVNALLEGKSSYRFIRYPDKDSLFEAVAGSQVDCGFVLDSRLDEAVLTNDWTNVSGTEMVVPVLDGTIDLITSTSSTKADAVSENLYTCLLAQISPELLRRNIETGTIFINTNEKTVQAALDMMAFVQSDNQTFTVSYSTVDENGQVVPLQTDSDPAPEMLTESDSASAAESVAAADDIAADAVKPNASTRANRSESAARSARNQSMRVITSLLLFAAALIFAAGYYRPETRLIITCFRGSGFLYQLLDLFAPLLLIGLLLEISLLVSGAASAGSAALLIPYLILCSLWAGIFVRFFPHEPVYLFVTIAVIIIAICFTPNLSGSLIIPRSISVLRFGLPTYWYQTIL